MKEMNNDVIMKKLSIILILLLFLPGNAGVSVRNARNRRLDRG